MKRWGDLPALPRLLDAVAQRAHRGAADEGPAPAGVTFVAGAWSDDDPRAAVPPDAGRILVMSCVGAHPDAHAPELRRQWTAEERLRALGLPTLVIRLGPLVGPGTPLWERLRTGSSLPRGGRTLLRPVAEEEVVEAMLRVFQGEARWEGWFEACGAETWTLAELASLAKRSRREPRPGSWEPPIEVLLEQRLPDSEPWRSHFGISGGGLAERAAAWG